MALAGVSSPALYNLSTPGEGMTEEKDDLSDYLRNHLKDVDPRTLEKTIAKAVSDLVGVELRCSITKIDYSPKHVSRTSATFDVSLSEPFRGFDFGLGQKEEAEK
jgi:hypothetical protein